MLHPDAEVVIQVRAQTGRELTVHFAVVDDLVDQPVTARDDQFSQPFVSTLWNDPTSPRELTKRFRCSLGFSLQNDGISRRSTRDEPGLFLDVRPRGGRPPHSRSPAEASAPCARREAGARAPPTRRSAASTDPAPAWPCPRPRARASRRPAASCVRRTRAAASRARAVRQETALQSLFAATSLRSAGSSRAPLSPSSIAH